MERGEPTGNTAGERQRLGAAHLEGVCHQASSQHHQGIACCGERTALKTWGKEGNPGYEVLGEQGAGSNAPVAQLWMSRMLALVASGSMLAAGCRRLFMALSPASAARQDSPKTASPTLQWDVSGLLPCRDAVAPPAK